MCFTGPDKRELSHVFFLFIKRPAQHSEFFRGFADLLAVAFFLFRKGIGVFDFFTFKLIAFTAGGDTVLLDAGQQHEAARGPTAAAGAADLLIADHVIPPTGLIPENRGFVQLFLCLCQIPGAYRAVVPAHGNDRSLVIQFCQLVDIPLHGFVSSSLLCRSP